MNRNLRTLAFLIGAFVMKSQAQITINQSDFVTVGKQFTMVTTFAANITPGGTGSQTWNFGSLSNDGETLYDVQSPAWTPFGSSYPTANMAFQLDNEYQYLKIDASGIIGLGQTGFGGNIPLNPTEKMVVFPSTMNTTFNGTSKFRLQIDTNIAQTLGTIDSIRVIGTRVKTSTIDAYGNITTPAGTFPSLRMKETVIETDSIFAKLVVFGNFGTWISIPSSLGIPNPIVDTTVTYTWFGNNMGYKIASFSYDSINGASNIEWLKQAPTASSVNEVAGSNRTKVYPNPSTGELFFTEAVSQVEIFSLDGNKILSSLVNMNQSIRLDELSNGNYLVVAKNANNEITTKQIVNIQK